MIGLREEIETFRFRSEKKLDGDQARTLLPVTPTLAPLFHVTPREKTGNAATARLSKLPWGRRFFSWDALEPTTTELVQASLCSLVLDHCHAHWKNRRFRGRIVSHLAQRCAWLTHPYTPDCNRRQAKTNPSLPREWDNKGRRLANIAQLLLQA